MGPLKNPKHEAFARALIRGKTQAEAYELAGYEPSEQHASRLASSGKVLARLAELQERVAEKTVLTAARLIEMAEDARQLAMSIDQPSAACAAIQCMGKLSGLWVEKRENINRNADSISDDELADYLTGTRGADAPKAAPRPSKLN